MDWRCIHDQLNKTSENLIPQPPQGTWSCESLLMLDVCFSGRRSAVTLHVLLCDKRFFVLLLCRSVGWTVVMGLGFDPALGALRFVFWQPTINLRTSILYVHNKIEQCSNLYLCMLHHEAITIYNSNPYLHFAYYCFCHTHHSWFRKWLHVNVFQQKTINGYS